MSIAALILLGSVIVVVVIDAFRQRRPPGPPVQGDEKITVDLTRR